MSGEVLTSRQQVCLVRVARERLSQLREEYDALSERGDIGNARDWLGSEIECIEAAIRWLWRQPVDWGSASHE